MSDRPALYRENLPEGWSYQHPVLVLPDGTTQATLVPVEPVGTLTVAEKDFGIQTLRVDDGTEYVVSTGLPLGKYDIVPREADDE